MEFVTGKAGTNHISGADKAAMFRGLLVSEDVVLEDGDQLSCTLLDANTVELGTGSFMFQGHHVRVETAEQITITSGSPGYKRITAIIARYSLGDGNIQSIYSAAVDGTAVAGTPSAPTLVTGSIDGGDVLVEIALWYIEFDGITPGTPYRAIPTIENLQHQVAARGCYATSSTAAATAAKVADYPGFVLTTGATVYVRFANANSAASATLNVNSTGAKPIYNNNSTTAANLSWVAGETVPFVYDGSAWRMVNSAGLVALRESVSKNALSWYTDISGYTDSEFTVPADGFVEVANTSTKTGAALIMGSNASSRAIFHGNGTSGRHAMFVKKGMRVKIQGTVDLVWYYELQ